ncbi:MAG: hypothetical protein ACLT3H_01090 [Roseburia sp.]
MGRDVWKVAFEPEHPKKQNVSPRWDTAMSARCDKCFRLIPVSGSPVWREVRIDSAYSAGRESILLDWERC